MRGNDQNESGGNEGKLETDNLTILLYKYSKSWLEIYVFSSKFVKFNYFVENSHFPF